MANKIYNFLEFDGNVIILILHFNN